MSDRTTREERERLGALTGEDDLEAVDPREERSVQPATYPADGVCSGPCGTDADDAPEAFVEAALEAVEEWAARNEPLTPQAFDDLRARFAREPGVPAVPRDGVDTGAVHLREVSAEEIGTWVADTDVALLDLDDTVRFADLHGVPVDEDAIVPLVVAAEGLFGEVAEDFHAHFHALQSVRDRLGGEGRVLTDGGPDDPTPLDAQQWATALDEATPQTFGEVVRVLEESDMVDGEPRELVEAALDGGTLVETEDFRIVLTDGGEDGNSKAMNPTPEEGEMAIPTPDIPPVGESWADVDFTAPGADTYPPELLEREQWMGRRGKLPFAPWGDRDHPKGEPDKDARYKWGIRDMYADGQTVALAEDDPRLDGRVFIQREDDPYAFVDGDDVRDPETGEVHPAFQAILEHLGVTYADVSTSGAGVHAYYRAEDGLPIDGKGQAAFDIDTEPWGANDEPPTVEVYANKHVNVATGEHLPGTPLEVNRWDEDVLRTILRSAGYEDKDLSHDTDRDRAELEDHDPQATAADETTTEVRDILLAVDRLEPSDLPLAATQTGVDSTGWSTWDPSYRTSSSGESLHYNGEGVFHDHKEGEAFGVLSLFAAEEGIISDPWGRLEGQEWRDAVDAAREAGAPIPQYEPRGGGGATNPDDYRRDPTKADVVLEPRRAWDAAKRVTPDDLDDHPLDPDGDGWADPATGAVVGDVARAVAIAEYPDVSVDTPLGDRYAEAYRLARDRYGAPLPEYLTQADAVERFDYVLGAVRELTYWHLDEDALTVDVTGANGDVSGEAVRTLDPTPADGWRDSESGESVLVFPSGTVYDVDLGEDGGVIDALRFVALDAGLLEDATDPLEGEDFTEAYRLARDRYGAPLPRWNAGTPDVTPVLPPAEELVDTPASVEHQEESLTALREDVETLYRDTIREADGVDVLNVLPALGKTTSAIKTAADTPTTYVAARKELMKQAEEKALEHGATYQHLPVFAEANLVGEAVERGVEAVREGSMNLLKNRWELLERAGVGDDGEMYAEEDEDADTVDLDRATCTTAEGEHGDAWAFAVHVARSLDYSPRDIHERAEALFGTALPCQGDEEDGEACDYSDGWDAVSDPDDPVDLLIGHYTHAYVESARTHYSRSPNGNVQKSPRVVVLDEFPGRSFTETFDEDALEHAVWLAGALTDDVDDRQDLLERDVWGDDLVRSWLEGEAAEEGGPTHDLATTLRAREAALSAAETAAEILDGYEDLLEEYDLGEALRRVRDGVAGLSPEERAVIAGQVRTAADTVEAQTGAFRVLRWADREVAAPLASSTDTDLEADTSVLPDGELLAFVETALKSDDPGMLRAAATALSGGDDGARELSVFAEDGYAHRKAHYLLEAAVRPPQDGDNPKIATENFTFGTEDGTTLKHVQVNDNVTVVLDRNGRGAEVLQPPGRTAAGGEDVPVVGLDATARRRLWEVALGADVRLRDVHDSMRERARTLRDVHDLQIVQTSKVAKAYEGDPSGKNLDADVALLEAIADEYAGVHGPRERGEDPDVVGNPAVITTKVVREVLEEDARLADVVDAWDNYGNLKGSNDLADHRLATLLGSQHYGDAEVERFAALAGEEANRSDYGMALDYGSDVANTYLKHMREDQVMQAALRFARGESGAVVFVHTAAIREDLPVVGRGEVVKSWTETATTIAEEWQRHPGEEFTVADVADAVDVSRRQVRRVLDEFVGAGYLERHGSGAGRANVFTSGERPGAGEVELDADVATPGGAPGQDPLEVYYTGNVRVAGRESLLDPAKRGGTTPLPAPDALDAAEATAGPPE